MSMNSCCHCEGAGEFFSDKRARRELKRYRKRGPDKSTRLLLKGLAERDLAGDSVLDIGGGVGTLQHELVELGATEVHSADASQAYLDASRVEAERRGYAHRASYTFGDFVEIAEQIPEVDVVTLDRVVCCYPDMPALVSGSASKARSVYGLVFPRQRWPVRMVIAVLNLLNVLKRSAFRVFIHRPDEIDSKIRSFGFERQYSAKTFVWQVAVYAR